MVSARFLWPLSLVVVLLHSASGLLTLPALVPPAPVKVAPATRPAPSTGELLASRRLVVPVQGVRRSQLHDTFEARRGMGRKHRAIDIMAPWGTPVLAADDGRLAKIASNRSGGLTLYQVDASGRFVYYYAHLTGYADDLREGQPLRRGDVIGYVGTTGNANAPHLHFQVMVLAEEKRWWGGEPVNPYQALVQGPDVLVAR